MHELHIIYNWVFIHKADLLGIVGGAAGLSVFLEGLLLKLKNKWHIDSHAFALSLLHILGVVGAGASWYLSNSLTGKATAGVYASLVIVAEFWQRFAVSPLYSKFIIPFLTYQSNQKTALKEVPAIPVDPSAPQFQ